VQTAVVVVINVTGNAELAEAAKAKAGVPSTRPGQRGECYGLCLSHAVDCWRPQ